MSSPHPPRPKSIRLQIAGKTHVATYDVQDGCVQVTHKGRRSVWTELRGLQAEDVAKMLLKELLGVLLAALCINALAAQMESPRRSHLRINSAPHVESAPEVSA